jgi:tRNA (guanine37-N1)-methyltransferase
MEIDVFTLFPEAFAWFEGQRHVANAIAHGARLEYVNYRDHTPLTGGQVDDMPFGGGAGMVLRVDVVEAALRARYATDPASVGAQRRVIALTPGGRVLDEELVSELAREPALTLLCGRYEGFDERVLEHLAGDRVSIGRYVLAGGELAAMVVCDAVLRKLPGALGDERSALEESFSQALEGAPEYPHYTRPAEHRGWRVPEVLLSGHHARIREWRLEQSRRRAESGGAG